MSTFRQRVQNYIEACEVLLRTPDLSDQESEAVQEMARRLTEELWCRGEETTP